MLTCITGFAPSGLQWLMRLERDDLCSLLAPCLLFLGSTRVVLHGSKCKKVQPLVANAPPCAWFFLPAVPNCLLVGSSDCWAFLFLIAGAVNFDSSVLVLTERSFSHFESIQLFQFLSIKCPKSSWCKSLLLPWPTVLFCKVSYCPWYEMCLHVYASLCFPASQEILPKLKN